MIGRTNAGRYFFKSNCSNVITCNDPIWDNSTGILPPPYGSWGAFSQLVLDGGGYIKLGAFESDPNQYLDKGHGFDWGSSDSAGASLLAAVGRKTTFMNTAYPGQYELIGFYNTSDQYDPRTGELDQDGNGGVMLKFRQAIWRPDGGRNLLEDPQALMLFGSLEAAPGKNQPYQAFAEAGVTYLNPFDRLSDMASVKVSYARLGDRQRQAQREARVAQGGVDTAESSGVHRFEMNYHLGLPHYMFLEPSVQYIVNPSNFFNPGARRLNDDGMVVALQFGIDFGLATGLTHLD
ncbi:carbohydrate porin [Halomonas sp. WWR20]